jgi:serine/threonine protein kinase
MEAQATQFWRAGDFFLTLSCLFIAALQELPKSVAQEATENFFPPPRRSAASTSTSAVVTEKTSSKDRERLGPVKQWEQQQQRPSAPLDPEVSPSSKAKKTAYVPPSPITEPVPGLALSAEDVEKFAPSGQPISAPAKDRKDPHCQNANKEAATTKTKVPSMLEKGSNRETDEESIDLVSLGEESLEADDILTGLGGGSRRTTDFNEPLSGEEHFDQIAFQAIEAGLIGQILPEESDSNMGTVEGPNKQPVSHAMTFEYPAEAPEPSAASGMRFDELYRLKGVLGTGAFSTVREGFHRSNTGISYAVKCINRKKLSEEDEAALLDEVSILKEMKHPHIIRLFDFFTEPSTYYLVMERMRGGELFDRIVAKAYYNEKEARDTCKILLEAVDYCHQNHVAHRDLKPENLLLLSDHDDSQVKLADFGFAKKVYEPNSLTTQCGTPGYVAPEILEGTAYDERADMWSVGVILYILLGGYPPFIESTQRDLFRKIRKGDYEFHEEYWGTVSTDAKELISSLLTVNSNDRLTAKDALVNNWILGDDAQLASKDLGTNLEKLRNFNGKRKFRAAVSTVMAVNKLNLMGKEFFLSVKEGGKDEPES